MNSAQDCSRWREAIRAWVGESAGAEPAAQLKGHLAGCDDCRRYAAELRAAAAGLRWLAERPVEPSAGFRARWTRAVQAAAQPAGPGEMAAALAAWCRDLLWRNRRPVAGVAALWILALVFRLSGPGVSAAPQATAARSPVEIFRALEADKRLLAGDLGREVPVRSSPRRPRSTTPRSEGLPAAPAALAPEAAPVTCSTAPPQAAGAGPLAI